MSLFRAFMLGLAVVAVVVWSVTLRRELRKEYAVGRERGDRARNLVLMGASATVWVFFLLATAGVDLAWNG